MGLRKFCDVPCLKQEKYKEAIATEVKRGQDLNTD